MNNNKNLPDYNLPDYNKKKWKKIYNNNSLYKHNCYAYALNQYNDLNITNYKPQMGNFGYPNKIKTRSLKSCNDLKHRVLIDNPHIYSIYYNQKCKKNYYKTYLFIAPNKDYHWYRQDKNGLYSHKPGITEITDKNISHKIITNPLLANRTRITTDYDNDVTDYTMACDAFCVPNNDTYVE
jgi:hypothetical protein